MKPMNNFDKNIAGVANGVVYLSMLAVALLLIIMALL
jgi:hypothetical protein